MKGRFPERKQRKSQTIKITFKAPEALGRAILKAQKRGDGAALKKLLETYELIYGKLL